MNNLRTEIERFLAVTGIPISALARQASVSRPSISYLLNGKRKSVRGPAQDRIRAAMCILSNGKGVVVDD